MLIKIRGVQLKDKPGCREQILESLNAIDGIPHRTQVEIICSDISDLQGKRVVCADVIPDEDDFDSSGGELIINEIMRVLEYKHNLIVKRYQPTTSPT